MIEHADAALEAWLSVARTRRSTSRFERLGSDDASGGRPRARARSRSLLHAACASRRTSATPRSPTCGPTTAGWSGARPRRGSSSSTTCAPSAGRPARHTARSATCCNCSWTTTSSPSSTCPRSSLRSGYPIDTMLVSPATSVAALTLRVVLPVQPTPDRDIGPPATSLHLDMAPPPLPKKCDSARRRCRRRATPVGPVPEKKWTTVRRRELIGRQQRAAALPRRRPPSRSRRGRAAEQMAISVGVRRAMLQC